MTVKIYTVPYNDWTREERQRFFIELKEAIDLGLTITLGYKRCFFCGEELGAPSGAKAKTGEGQPQVITKLCDRCYDMNELAKVLQ